ncbi:MAG: hypothetical protein PHH77_05205 [Victivallaceae bacterium]|nr:hypothetical protein [Victivallaceae bacterium]
MSDPDYRALLSELTGAVSSTDPRLDENDYQAVMKALNGVSLHPDVSVSAPSLSEGAAPRGRRIGWQEAQVRKFRQYVRLCRMDMNEGRQVLYRAGGAMNEESPYLSQIDFDDTMATIEAELEVRVQTGRAAVPGNIDLRYWRKRRPGKGAANTRETHLIDEFWRELSGYLSTEKQNAQYLLGFIAHTCHFARAKAVKELKAAEALKVIDALKKRLEQERNKIAAEVPF